MMKPSRTKKTTPKATTKTQVVSVHRFPERAPGKSTRATPQTRRGALSATLPEVAGVATYPPGATFGPRRMLDYEFVLMIKGDAEYRRANLRVAAPEGSLVLCRPGAVDAFRWDMSQRTQHAFFHFQIQQFPEHWPAPDQWPLVRVPENDDIIVTLFRYLMTRAGHIEPMAGLLALELMLETFVSGESRVAAIPQTPLPEAVERAHQHLLTKLEREPRAPIPLGELARAAYVSPEHLCRLFKDSTGYSPLETVRLARLDRAATLLARTNYSVAEIAGMTGFASPFHFSRKFKEAFGQAPRELRQSIRSGETPPTPRLLRTQHNI